MFKSPEAFDPVKWIVKLIVLYSVVQMAVFGSLYIAIVAVVTIGIGLVLGGNYALGFVLINGAGWLLYIADQWLKSRKKHA